MSQKISKTEAQNYIDCYAEICAEKEEKPGEFIKCFTIDYAALESIKLKAEAAGITCTGIRLYFGKQTTDNAELPKYAVGLDYNVVIVGVNASNENIITTGEIYDNFDPCPEYNCPGTGIDFE